MKVLVFGANGFLGREVVRKLKSSGHKIAVAINKETGDRIDLLDKKSIEICLERTEPDIIVNCAGVVDNSEKAFQNSEFTSNILEAVVKSKIRIVRVIIAGSAAEYGEVDDVDAPVQEETPLNAKSLYGISKVDETQKALELSEKHDISVIVARIFNPIGTGMHKKFLISRILNQIDEIKSHKREAIEVTRLDSKRDYIDVRDVATAIITLIDHIPTKNVYNIGSGNATSNSELIQAIVAHSNLQTQPMLRENSEEPEPPFAARADISRIRSEFGWEPRISLSETVKEIVSNEK